VEKEPNLGRAEFFALPFPGSYSVFPASLPLLALELNTDTLITDYFPPTAPPALMPN
jgi:hypothetical protein